MHYLFKDSEKYSDWAVSKRVGIIQRERDEIQIFGEVNISIHLDESGGDSVGVYWAGLLVLVLLVVGIKQNLSASVRNAKRTDFIIFMKQKEEIKHTQKTE